MSTPSKLKQLLKYIDRYPAQSPTPNEIMEPPAITYQILKLVYNDYKKSNELKILQNKIYTLQLKDYDETNLQTQNPLPMTSPNSITSIRALLSSSSNNKLTTEAVDSLIELKEYLPPNIKGELLRYVIYEIEKINDLQAVLSSYKKILKTSECIDILKKRNENYQGFFYYVQDSMIKKVLSLDLKFKKDFDDIAKFLISLPFLKNNPSLVEFIGEIFEKVINLTDFNSLLAIFKEIVDGSRNFTLKKKYYCKNTDKITEKEFEEICQKVKIKITIPQFCQEIQGKLQRQVTKQSSPQQFQERDKFLKMLKEQAKSKLKQLLTSSEYLHDNTQQNQNSRGGENTMDIEQVQGGIYFNQSNISDKNKSTLALIFMVVRHCPELWEPFINFHSQTTPILQSYSNLLIQKIIGELSNQNIANNMKIWVDTILLLLIKYQDQKSISQLFLNKLMNIVQNQKNPQGEKFPSLLQSKTIRKFLALKIMQEEEQVHWNTLTDPKGSCQLIDIILQMFCFEEKCLQFFGTVLENYQKKDRLDIFLSNLRDKKPQKFKEFYQKVDQTSEGQIFEFQQFHLLRYLKQIVIPYPQIAINFVRDMSSYTPSRFCVSMMLGFCRNFKDDSRPYIVSQCARTLKSILMNFSYEQLCIQFKNHLSEFHQDFPQQAEFIFKYVPQEMTDKLKIYYDSRGPKI